MCVQHKVFIHHTNMASKPVETDEERIVKAENYKAEGNEFFKKEEYKAAVKRYHFALLYAKGIGEKHPITGDQNILTDEWNKRLAEVKFSTYNNLAGAYLYASCAFCLYSV